MTLGRAAVVLALVALIAGIGGIGLFAAPAAADGHAGMSGSGSASDPYEITNATQLQAIEQDMDAHYVLANDVDLGGISNFDPIGDGNAFQGTLDGDGHAIENLRIQRADTYEVGLFEYLGSWATVEDVRLAHADVHGSQSVGALAAKSQAQIRRVSVTGSVTADSHHAGSLVATNHGSVSGVVTDVAVDAGGFTDDSRVGGLVGENTDSISNSYATGSVTGDRNVGGLVGYNAEQGEISGVYATASVDSAYDTPAGLVGENRGSISAAYWNLGSSGTGVTDGSSGDATGRTLAQIRGPSAWKTMSSLAFGDRWVTRTGETPLLLWESDAPTPAEYAVEITGANDVLEGESLVVTANVTNLGTEAGVTKDLTLTDTGFEGEARDTVPVVLGAGESNDSVELVWDTAVGENGTGDVTVSSGDDSDATDATVQQRATFEITDLSDVPDVVYTGESISIDVGLENAGDVGGSKKVALEIGNLTNETRNVTLAGGETTTETFTVETTDDDSGDYDATVSSEDDERSTGAFAVRQLATFDLADVDAPESVDAGETLVYNATVENVGDLAGSTGVVFSIDGERVETTTVGPDGGDAVPVSFEYGVNSTADTGTLDATIVTTNDSATRTVRVDGNETLSGAVTDGATGEALSGLNVTVDDGESVRTVETDENGTYSVTVLNASDVSVSANATVGDERSLEIRATNATTVDGATMLDLSLHPDLDGSGTRADPYEVSNAREMQAMSLDLSGHYVLVEDVNASGTAAWNDGRGFEPVGTTDDYLDPNQATMFWGSLDGRNRTVTGLTIDRPNEPFIGLFGAARDTTVRDLSLTNVGIRGASEEDVGESTATGGLIGLSGNLTASAVHVSGVVETGYSAGGVVGSSYGAAITGVPILDLRNVTASVTVTTSSDEYGSATGGVIGYWGGLVTVADSRTSGDVFGRAQHVGGFAGWIGTTWDEVELSTISNVTARGNVTPSGSGSIDIAGGLVGTLYNAAIDNSSATGDVNSGSGDRAGGLVGGPDSETRIDNSYATGDVAGGGDAGGLVGMSADEITDSFAAGSVSGETVAGIAINSVGEMENVYWNASTAATATESGSDTGAYALTPAQMTGANATEHMDGLDYETTWLAVEDTSPVLGSQVSDYHLQLPDELDVGDTTEATVAVTLRDGTETTATTTSNYTASGNVSTDANGTITAASTYGPGTVIATGGGLTDSASITALDSDLRISFDDVPRAVGAGETETFPVVVENVGTDEGTVPLSLAFDGTEFYDESVSIAAGANRTIATEYEIPAGIETGTVALNASTPDDAANTTVDVRGFETLSGTLTDGVTGEPLSGVDVEVDGEVEGTTDANGAYAVEVVNGTDVTISASPTLDAPGSPVLSAPGPVAIDGSTTQDLTLWPDLAGSGTVADPHEISNAHELQAMSRNPSAHYVLTDDVDASETESWNDGAGFDPIGDGGADFTGSFDGRGHTIDELTIDRPSAQYVGLFRRGEGPLSDVALTNVSIDGDTAVGGLVGFALEPITNVAVGGTVGGRLDVGGLAGSTDASVTNVSSTASVTGTSDWIGGLIGSTMMTTTVSDALATGNVTGNSQVGGLIGASEGDVRRSLATGLVVGSTREGGVIGENRLGSRSGVYWDVATTDQSDGIGNRPNVDVTGLPTANLTGATANASLPEFDFEDTWIRTDGYPRLRSSVGAIDLSADDATLHPGATTDVTVTLDLAAADTTTVSTLANYTSSAPGVATIDDGRIDAQGVGTATISATYGGTTDSIAVRVTSPPDDGGEFDHPPIPDGVTVTDVAVDVANPSVGETVSATVTVENEGAFAETYAGTLDLDGVSIAEESIGLDGGETASFTVSHEFEAAGEYVLSAGGESVTITVDEESDADDGSDDSDSGGDTDDGDGSDGGDGSGDGADDAGDDADDGTDGDGSGSDGTPGFGVLAALLAIVGGSLLARRRV